MKDRADRLVAGFYAVLGGIFGIGVSLVLFWYRHGPKWSGWAGLSICIVVGLLCAWLAFRFRGGEAVPPLPSPDQDDNAILVRRLGLVICIIVALYCLWDRLLG